MKFIILLFLFPAVPFAQSSKKAISDTTLIVGLLSQETYVGKSIDAFCLINYEKLLAAGKPVLISGVRQCKKSYEKDFAYYYEIAINNEAFFIEKSKVFIAEEGHFQQLINMTAIEADTFRTIALRTSELLFADEMRKAVTSLSSLKSKGLAILTWSYSDESEYTEGTSAEVKVYNPTSKIIKYLWFTFVGYNPVGDKVIDRKRGTSAITVKGVGPIKPQDAGTYTFDYVWFTDMVETARITQVKVQYMDGTVKLITNPMEITISKAVYNTLFEE